MTRHDLPTSGSVEVCHSPHFNFISLELVHFAYCFNFLAPLTKSTVLVPPHVHYLHFLILCNLTFLSLLHASCRHSLNATFPQLMNPYISPRQAFVSESRRLSGAWKHWSLERLPAWPLIWVGCASPSQFEGLAKGNEQTPRMLAARICTELVSAFVTELRVDTEVFLLLKEQDETFFSSSQQTLRCSSVLL